MGVENEKQYKDETGMIQDDYRIEFIKMHLDWLIRGIEEGSNCKVICYGRLLIMFHQ